MNGPFAAQAVADENAFNDGRSLQVGVLTNPRSGGNKKGCGEVRRILAGWPNLMHLEAVTPEGVSQVLTDFAQHGVELIVINGGDGTVQASLTAIANETPFPQPPLFALLRAGTTSMLARDVGIAGAPVAGLLRVLQWAKSSDNSLVVRSRPVLRVLRGTRHPSLYGMFFGAGAICQGIKAFHHRHNPMGWRGELMPAVTMLRLLLAILRKDRVTVPPLLTRTRLDGGPVQARAELLVLVSTLERLFLGMRPYWGDEHGPLRYTAVDAQPRYLLRIVFSLLRAVQSRYATPDNGYYSHNVREVQIEMAGDFTLDGELYSSGEGAVTIASAGTARFLGLR